MEGRGRIDLSNLQNQIKAWRDIWSAGHGVGAVKKIQPLAEVVSQLLYEYDIANSGSKGS